MTYTISLSDNCFKFLCEYMRDTLELDEVAEKIGLDVYDMVDKLQSMLSKTHKDNYKSNVIPYEKQERNGVSFISNVPPSIAEFKTLKDVKTFFGSSEITKLDIEGIESNSTLFDWIETRYPDFFRYEHEWSLYNHRDILTHFRELMTVNVKDKQLLIAIYDNWVIVATPMCHED